MGTKEVLTVLADPTRFDVLNRIATGGPASASALANDMPVSRQAISKHLNALEDAGLLERRRAGREVQYTFEPGPLDDVVSWVRDVGTAWDVRLARLKRAID